MKKSIGKMLVVIAVSLGMVSTVSAMDVNAFKKIARNTIKVAMSGSVSDVNKMIADQARLVEMGVQGCKEYAEKDAKYAKLMNLVVQNAEKMKTMSLDEIEAAWHEGAILKTIGLDFDSIDHMSPALSHMDTVVHPATTYILFNLYKKSKDADHLEQVKDELSEVLEHIDHL